jgi:hypothetical protein
MTSVLVTKNVELPAAAHQCGKSPSENFDTAILRRVADGQWEVKYRIERLAAHGVKVVFLVEALSA